MALDDDMKTAAYEAYALLRHVTHAELNEHGPVGLEGRSGPARGWRGGRC